MQSLERVSGFTQVASSDTLDRPALAADGQRAPPRIAVLGLTPLFARSYTGETRKTVDGVARHAVEPVEEKNLFGSGYTGFRDKSGL